MLRLRQALAVADPGLTTCLMPISDVQTKGGHVERTRADNPSTRSMNLPDPSFNSRVRYKLLKMRKSL